MPQFTKHDTAATLPHPGRCTLCGVNYDRFFYVSTGVETEWEGVISLCNECIGAIVVKSWGFNPITHIEELEIQVEGLNERYAAESAAYAGLLAALKKIHIDPETVFAMAEIEDDDGLRSRYSDSEDNGRRNADEPLQADGEVSRDDSESSDGSTGSDNGESPDSTESGDVDYAADAGITPESDDTNSNFRVTF